jgi:UDP-N-acetyl-D-mannosaminuronate dehydrogenase
MIATLLARKNHIVHVHDPLASLPTQLLMERGMLQIKELVNLDYYEFIVLAVDWPEYESIKSNIRSERLIQIF